MSGQAGQVRPASILPRYPQLRGGTIRPLGSGLINETYLVEVPDMDEGPDAAGPSRAVLQRVSPIFSPAIHDNIVAVTRRLEEAGVATPSLLHSADGQPYVELDGAVWRVMTYVEGATFHAVETPTQAHAAAHLVARFHAALARLEHHFVGMRVGVHDTPAHLAALRRAIADAPAHRLHGAVATLGQAILERAAVLPRLPDLPPIVGHGDLKLNNVRFAGRTPPASREAVCLIDLDTVGPISLAYELGDAWRSWCNEAGEDDPEARVSMEIFRASLAGYQAGLPQPLTEPERQALLLGPEWVSLELAARFAADAINESYFGWNRDRYPGRGEHNLVRAQGQWSLHLALARHRPARATLLHAQPLS